MDWDTQVARWINESKVWTVIESSLAAVVTAVPTVTAGISLFNGNPEGGKSFLVLALMAIQGGTPATLNSWGIVHNLSSLATGTAEPGAGALLDTDDVVINLKGGSGKYGGAAVVDIGETVINDRWTPIGDSVNTVVISLTGTQIHKTLKPVVEVPPNGLYSLMGVGSTNDLTVRKGFIWAELEQEELDNLGLAA